MALTVKPSLDKDTGSPAYDQDWYTGSPTYEDIVTGDAMLYDRAFKNGKGHCFKELVHGMIWQVEAEFILHGIPIYGEIETVIGLDLLVHPRLLKVKRPTEAKFRAYMDKYRNKLAPLLPPGKKEEFEQHFPEAVDFLASKLPQFKFYTGQWGHLEGSPAFAYRENPKIMLFLACGLRLRKPVGCLLGLPKIKR